MVLERLKLRMAIAEKRTLGVAFEWLGVIFVPLVGLVFIPRNKLLRALAALRAARGGTLVVGDYRSLLGLLEHVRGVLRISRCSMHGLWRLLTNDPAACVVFPAWAQRRLDNWIDMLSATGGRTIFDVLRPEQEWLTAFVARERQMRLWLVVSTDAARSHDPRARKGLGFYCHGFYMHFPIIPFAMELLPIGILELLAIVFALLSLGPRLPKGAFIRLETDSISSAFTLTEETARTACGQLALQLLLANAIVNELLPHIFVQHIFGDANPFADCASRGKLVELRRRCVQVKVQPVSVSPSPDAVHIYLAVLKEAAREAGRLGEYNRLLLSGGLLLPRADPVVGTSSSSFLWQEDIEFMFSLAQRLAAQAPQGSPPARESTPPSGTGFTLGARLRPADAVPPPAYPAPPRPQHPKPTLPLHQAVRDLYKPRAPSSPTTSGWITLEHLKRLAPARAAAAQPDRGELTLRPADPTLLAALEDERAELGQAALNAAQLRKDESSWNRYWVPITKLLGTASVRRPPTDAPSFVDGADIKAETLLLCYAFLLIMAMMAPRSKHSPAAKPSSGHSVLGAVRRMHLHLGLLMVPSVGVRSTLDALKARFVRRHGHEALMPKRKSPIMFPLFSQLLLLTSVPLSATRVWNADSLLGLSTLAMICMLYSSGFRKAEIVSGPWHTHPLTFASLSWNLGGQVWGRRRPPDALLLRPRPGDFVQVFPRESKCDSTGEVWGDRPAYLHFSDDEVGNAFKALARLEVAAAIEGELRHTTPLFIDDARQGVAPYEAETILHAMLLATGVANAVLLYTWHSFRISLATRLHRANVSELDIQAICRWQSPASLKIYIKMGAEDYRERLGRAHGQEITRGEVPTFMLDAGSAFANVGANQLPADSLRRPLPPPPTAARAVATPRAPAPVPAPAPVAMGSALRLRGAGPRAAKRAREAPPPSDGAGAAAAMDLFEVQQRTSSGHLGGSPRAYKVYVCNGCKRSFRTKVLAGRHLPVCPNLPSVAAKSREQQSTVAPPAPRILTDPSAGERHAAEPSAGPPAGNADPGPLAASDADAGDSDGDDYVGVFASALRAMPAPTTPVEPEPLQDRSAASDGPGEPSSVPATDDFNPVAFAYASYCPRGELSEWLEAAPSFQLNARRGLRSAASCDVRSLAIPCGMALPTLSELRDACHRLPNRHQCIHTDCLLPRGHQCAHLVGKMQFLDRDARGLT